MTQEEAAFIVSAFQSTPDNPTDILYKAVQDKATKRWRVEAGRAGGPPLVVISTVVQFLHLHMNNVQNQIITKINNSLNLIANMVAAGNPQAAAAVKAAMGAHSPYVGLDGGPLA